MYFPHLISGPIIRFLEFIPQSREALKLPSSERIATGFELLLLGYVFKVFIADPVSVLADPVFSRPGDLGVLASYLGVLAFTVQIYFDFMGYTHIARGVSLLFNIELPVNFNHPYLATNISNFWERWHISLSRWIRDYLYFPLGGSRGTLSRTAINLLITMLICGAWHGAGWTYILWGGYHGLLLAGYHLFKQWKKQLGGQQSFLATIADGSGQLFYQAGSIGLTFALVVLGWILFRSPSLAVAGGIIGNLLNIPVLLSELITFEHLDELLGILAMLAICWMGPWAIRGLAFVYRPLPFYLKAQLACILAFICWLLTAEGTVPFIYFQF